MSFDGSKSYNGEMKGQRLGKVIFLAHRNVSTEFVTDFMERGGMRIFYNGSQIANLSLRNTYAAVSEMLNCQRELGFTGATGSSGSGSSPRPADPFVSTPSRSSDPFR